MIIFPAIDLYDGKAVRLLRGDYNRMTVYSDDPLSVARDFERQGATHIHLVDLQGAKDGTTPNSNTVLRIARETSLFVQVGGGIRTMQTAEQFLKSGVSRVILGTAAVETPELLRAALAAYGDRIAVGADVKDGYIAVKGWVERSSTPLEDFMHRLASYGVQTVICTDISRDGAMRGTNLAMYQTLSAVLDVQLIASGGISSLDDIVALRKIGLYGAIIGKAYHTGAINLKKAIEVVK